MGAGIPFGFGVRFLMDAHLQYWRPGLPVALRVRNYDTPDAGYSELGFQYSPTGTMQDQSGFTDILILPQPEVKEVTLRDIGLNQNKLMFGAKSFGISNTFVLARMNAMGYTDPLQVFKDKSVVGLAYPWIRPPRPPNTQTRLFSIESITHEEVAGQTLIWTLLCNGTDELVPKEGS